MNEPGRQVPEPEQTPAQSKQPMLDNHDDYDFSQPLIEMRRGSLPGRERLRITYQANPEFHRIRDGVLAATEAAEIPSSGLARAGYLAKRLLIGVPLDIS